MLPNVSSYQFIMDPSTKCPHQLTNTLEQFLANNLTSSELERLAHPPLKLFLPVHEESLNQSELNLLLYPPCILTSHQQKS